MKRSAVLLVTVVGLSAAGCGDNKPVVSGSVTLDGQPVASGAIQFFPVSGEGQTAGATIEHGRYQVRASPGLMKVVINAPKVVGRRPAYDDEPNGPMTDVVRESLPARYSDMTKSELTFTVVTGRNEANFELQSGPKK